MRLIGNKTKLVDAIERFLARRGVTGGTLLEPFAGTASVGRHFRARGFRVRTNDLLMASYVSQRATIGLGRLPDLSQVVRCRDVARHAQVDPARDPLGATLAWLERGLEPADGLIGRQYAEGGPGGRLYFSRENGARIDAVHAQLVRWRREGRVDDDGFFLLLAALLEGADRAANISGTYGAFLKALQPNAREPLRLRPPPLQLDRPAGHVTRLDANEVVRRAPVDVLYLDPPYNHRQYAKNYHVLEVLAELHTVEDLPAYEAGIYGKTGLRPFEDRLSAYCRPRARGGRPSCAQAFADLVAAARAEHIVVSYSEEGILTREEIGAALARGRETRAYRVLEGRGRDEVAEWLFYVHKPAAARRRVAAHG
jgi:adenine-specific DNA-methyltransferase